MSGLTASGVADGRQATNAALFFKRWLANPLQMGSVIPSSRTLCRRIAALVERAPDEVVLEIGAGTGVISRALLLPGVNVICGDAFELPRELPERLHGKVGTAICGIPLVLLPLEQQRRFVAAVEAVAPGKGFLLYTYCITSPLPYGKLGLRARREAWTPLNFPPASVWRYQPRR
jgi:phosphatidylethanolamine/phosphatidyl-N-methylethanolamine N-methyltransferase